MNEPLDWNAKTIAEFRANEGRVGGNFEGAPIVLVHHRGRKSGREHVTPTMYLPHVTEPGIIYVFATKAGAPTNPDWYYNLRANPSVTFGDTPMDATVITDHAETERLWRLADNVFPAYAAYRLAAAKVDRTIPIIPLVAR